MSFLPLVQRELRAAARRKSTFRLRSWTVLVAMFASFSSLLIAALSGRGRSVGASLFSFISGYAFCLCLSAGVFLTADSLSREKREGTLGLLFLTNLRGYDVVLGKFCAASLNAFYGLIALLPFLGLPLLLGGVTGNEFWRMALALGNALFFSLAMGACASAFGRVARQAIGLTLTLLLAAVAAPLALAKLSSFGIGARLGLAADWLSPLSAFSAAHEFAYSARPGQFWGSLGFCQAVAWGGLALASWVLPRRWQSPEFTNARVGWTPWWRLSPGFSEARRLYRKKLLELHPVAWLAGREAQLTPLAWLVVMAGGVAALATSWSPVGAVPMMGLPGGFGASPFSGVVAPFGFLLKALCAIEAARFFTEARRTGTLETLMCTPLGSREIIAGPKLFLRRSFLPPAATFVGCLLLPALLQLAVASSKADFSQLWGGAFSLFLSLVYCLRLGVDLVAVALVAMWLALSLQRPNYAPLLTILYVLILPSPFCVLDLIVDLIFIVWASARLQLDLRWVLARRHDVPTRPVACPPVIAGAALPPAISG